MTREQVDHIIGLARGSSCSAAQIAEIVGVTRNAVIATLRKCSVPLPGARRAS